MWGEDAHGVTHSVEATAAAEDEEALQQVQAAGDVLQVQGRNPKRKLQEKQCGFRDSRTQYYRELYCYLLGLFPESKCHLMEISTK